jgi:hypothetical protein
LGAAIAVARPCVDSCASMVALPTSISLRVSAIGLVDLRLDGINVRFSPASGRSPPRRAGPLCAITGLMQCSKGHGFGIHNDVPLETWPEHRHPPSSFPTSSQFGFRSATDSISRITA